MKHLNAKESSEKPPVVTPTRIDKTLQWLEESRGSWKQKTQTSKAKLKTTTLALKRAREDRDKYIEKLKKQSCSTRNQLSHKEREIAMLKKQLEQKNQEVENLKKKK
jgi:chromosome segregation ATPase